MLLSMTGFGEARHQGDDLTLSVEVRTVNNRYLKVSVRGSEPYPMLEPELEKLVRKYVRRGTVTIHVRLDRQGRGSDYALNAVALRSYLEQVRAVCDQAGWQVPVSAVIGQVMVLPGVAPEPGGLSGRPPDAEFAAVERTLDAALKKLHGMRQQEGRAMAEELLGHRQAVAEHLSRIREQVPAVVENYRQRLRDRVGQALAEHNVTLRPEDLIREVAVFAERSDVAEEVMRLGSHLDQFEAIVRTEDDGPGRKLEFLVQEMGREANTIGSKAGDVGVSRHVVEIKAALEKVRELVQNVE
ncbi:MAG TPA: YicC/YloC family endoribonuclease [Gemmataceae bacterium]|nr:YicC/YloC family endoribonuclease [Gemmataceae bacterium]